MYIVQKTIIYFLYNFSLNFIASVLIIHCSLFIVHYSLFIIQQPSVVLPLWCHCPAVVGIISGLTVFLPNKYGKMKKKIYIFSQKFVHIEKKVYLCALNCDFIYTYVTCLPYFKNKEVKTAGTEKTKINNNIN